MTYTHLLVATGSRVRELGVPGEGLAGVNYLRSMADADHIIEDFSTARRIVIIGAGYIGLEVAAVAIGRGLEVTVIEASDRVLSRTVCPTMSRFYADYHRARGVDLHCSAPVARICGRDRVEAVEIADGRRFDADVVIVGIGIVPNVELASQAGLQVANGIRVDECSRTRDGSVLAAGDCTSHRHPFVDREIRLESVQNAIEQGKSAALQLTGEDRKFSDIPWFWSDQYDLKLQIAGLSLDYDQTVVRGDMDSASFSIYYLRQGKAIAVDSVNNPREFITAKKLLAAKPELPVDMIRDKNADLAALAV
jgi:3-phenylpropionate/trans-cinnamate dioxygenase ferredoxin reductase subunit